MKIGISSVCAPDWDLKTLLEQIVLLGLDGIELCGLPGELPMPADPLANRPEDIIKDLEAANVELVCLGSQASLGRLYRQETEDQKSQVKEYIDLAGRLNCPLVRVYAGDIPFSDRHKSLELISSALAELADYAQRQKVTLLVENCGELSGTRDLWFLVDAVSHPALQACWNPANGLKVKEPSIIAIPRIGSKLRLVHLTDAHVDLGAVKSYQVLGQGYVDVAHLVELLAGIAYEGYLMLEWPKLWVDSLADPQEYLPHAAKFLKAQLNAGNQDQATSTSGSCKQVVGAKK